MKVINKANGVLFLDESKTKPQFFIPNEINSLGLALKKDEQNIDLAIQKFGKSKSISGVFKVYFEMPTLKDEVKFLGSLKNSSEWNVPEIRELTRLNANYECYNECLIEGFNFLGSLKNNPMLVAKILNVTYKPEAVEFHYYYANIRAVKHLVENKGSLSIFQMLSVSDMKNYFKAIGSVETIKTYPPK